MLLQRLPVSEIKVDRSFVVKRVLTSPDDATIVRSIIDLAHALGIEAVAEGVETEEVWDLLEDLGCDSAQGWYVSRPMRRADLRWLAAGDGRAGAARRPPAATVAASACCGAGSGPSPPRPLRRGGLRAARDGGRDAREVGKPHNFRRTEALDPTRTPSARRQRAAGGPRVAGPPEQAIPK